MKKLFENFRSFINENEADLTGEEEELKNTPDGELNAAAKKKKKAIQHK